jgi:hypothetical protein
MQLSSLPKKTALYPRLALLSRKPPTFVYQKQFAKRSCGKNTKIPLHQRNDLCGINMKNWYKMHKWLCRSFLLALLIQNTSSLSECCILCSLARSIYEPQSSQAQ